MNSFIKIKMLSLGAEIKLIRREERKWLKKSRHYRHLVKRSDNADTTEAAVRERSYADLNFWGLRNHRIGLRPEARIANIAYGFVRGKPYKQIENKAYSTPNWTKVASLVQRYGEGFKEGDVKAKILEWAGQS